MFLRGQKRPQDLLLRLKAIHKIQDILDKKSTLQAILPTGKDNQVLAHFKGSATRLISIQPLTFLLFQ